MILKFTFYFHYFLLCVEFHRQIQDGGVVGVHQEAEDAERPDAASVRNLRSLRHDQVSFLESKVKRRRPFSRRPSAHFPTSILGMGFLYGEANKFGHGRVGGPCIVRGWGRRSLCDLRLANFITGNGHMGPTFMWTEFQTDMTENITFHQLR